MRLPQKASRIGRTQVESDSAGRDNRLVIYFYHRDSDRTTRSRQQPSTRTARKWVAHDSRFN